ncbi:biopolymer transporter ExbB [Sulfitobacter sp. D35]|uniref:biopolymer transporter ExbB n=1 Tax=Sulfitobacter sp. D35 TaxID=3083252 RepID=UPI00296E2EA2|nr:biopolymer transporter ExbB [Sulfitobacter sp. D35]MDW4499810.1 biopolymer transporter ExbB [Sulfitobacter sp. D35]
MAPSDQESRPVFSQPVRQIVLMLLVLGLSGAGAFLALPRVLPVFEANPYLNGFILFVFVIGVLACFYQVFQLIGSVRWIERFAASTLDTRARPPQLLAPLASLLRSRGARMQIGSTSARSILDSVATRIDEAREITRYIVNMLIFLGLLGTFYGLATTVPAVVDTIRNLAPEEGQGGVAVFNRLMSGLESQLGGMGVAFASSLLGLAGSLIVGLLELFAGHGQNRFYRELEEWLSSITRLGFHSGEEGGDQSGLTVVIDHMADQMEALQRLFARSEVDRSASDQRMEDLAEAIRSAVTDGPGDDAATQVLTRIAEGQERLADSQERLAQGQERVIAALEDRERGEGIDAESRMRLRSIDVQMLRILEEISAGRQESMSELRADLAALTDALSQPRRFRTIVKHDDRER